MGIVAVISRSTIALAPLGDPSKPGSLLATVEVPGKGSYLVEYREKTGLDRGFNSSAVVIRELREAVHEHILETVYDLSDLVEGRFRFVLGSRHSMGQGYAYPVSVLRDDVAMRRDQWRSIGDIIPSTSVVAQLNEVAPVGHVTVCVAASDWPLVRAPAGNCLCQASATSH